MSSNQRWIVGEDINSEEENEADAGISKPLLQANQIPTKTPFLRMMFFGSIVATPYVLAGMNLSFSSIALPQMNVDINEASWFGSLALFGSMFGSIAISLIIDKYGRRPSFIFSILFCIIGWTLLWIGTTINVMFLGQFLAGIMPGCICIGQIYAAESIVVNHHHLRNSFSTWSVIALTMGVILDAVLGRLIHYQTIALVAVVIAITSLTCIIIFIPESPQWLCQQGKIHRARLSEQQLYIHQPVLKDFDPKSVAVDTRLSWTSFKEGLQDLKRKDVFKPLITLVVWNTFVVLSGGQCIVAYQVNILSDYPLTSFSSDSNPNTLIGYNLAIISAILGLIAVTLTSILVTYTGIKKLVYLSAVGMAIGMAGLAVSLAVNEESRALKLWSFIHTSSVWLILFFFSLGGVTIPSSVLGEMYPQDSKRWASLSSIWFCGAGGILLKLHLFFYDNLGYILYFIYAFINLLTIVYVKLFVPETVGKTQEEIGKYFMQ